MSAYSDRVIADGASAYWRLNEPSGTTAFDLAGSAHGTISGAVTLGQPGALADGDKAMRVNGTITEKITTPAVTLPIICSVEAWIQSSAVALKAYLSTRPGSGTIIGKQATHEVFVYVSGFVVSTGLVGDGAWHHVVVTVSVATTRIYLDGVLDTTVAQAHPAETQPLTLGGDGNDVNLTWNGGLDEIAIYPRALTAQEIADHYALRLVPDSAGGGRPISLGAWKQGLS